MATAMRELDRWKTDRARMIESLRHEKPANVTIVDGGSNEHGIDDLECEIEDVCGGRKVGWVLWDDDDTRPHVTHVDFYEITWRLDAATRIPVAACEDCVLGLGWD
jgi:hypothetical protein